MSLPAVPPLPAPIGPKPSKHLVKDAGWGVLLAAVLWAVYWYAPPGSSGSNASLIDANSLSHIGSQSEFAEPDRSEVAIGNPLSESTTEPLSEADPSNTPSSEIKPNHSASLAPFAYAPDDSMAPRPEIGRSEENKGLVAKARQELLAAIAPTLPAERAQRPLVESERKVEFFSIQSKAQTVAFVVDCSASMVGAPFERCRLELVRAIISLHPDQAFYVLFFSGGPVPLPGSDIRSPQLSQAKSWVKHQIGVRIGSVPIHITGTNPDRSLQIAASINPDVIYLLTDGEFDPPPAPGTIQDIQNRKIVVNTIAFMSRTGAPYLESLASKTGGTYRFVPEESYDGLAGQLQRQMLSLLFAEARTADATELKFIHNALVAIARHDHGSLTIDDINRSLVPWRGWFLDLISQQWNSLTHHELAAILANGTIDEKIAVFRVIRKNQIEQLIPECIRALEADGEEVRQAARDALKEISGGYDWSPNPGVGDPAARTLEVATWERWQRMRKMVVELRKGRATDLKLAASDGSVDRRWAAAIAMGRENRIPVEWLLIPLTDVDALVRDAAVKSLQVKSRQLKNGDLGPELKDRPGRYLIDEILDLLKSPDPMVADSAERALIAMASPANSSSANINGETPPGAGTDWTTWWISRKEQQACNDLDLARKLLDTKNPALKEKSREAAAKRLREIILHYPGTPSAVTARQLMPTE